MVSKKIDNFIQKYENGEISDITFYCEWRRQIPHNVYLNHRRLDTILGEISNKYKKVNDGIWGTSDRIWSIYRSRKREEQIDELLG